MRKQKGLSLTSAVAWAVVLVFAALLAFKVGPAYIEYFAIKKNFKSIANDPGVSRTTASAQSAFALRSAVDDMHSISPSDLQIEKDGNRVIISASYSTRMPLFGNIGVCIDFNPSSEN